MKGKFFELVHRDGLARIAHLSTRHGVLETPAVLPVINPNLRVISASEMKAMGAGGIITNSYIIRRNPDLREKAEKNGVHSLVGYDGPIMTDSGTFQSYVYGDMEYGNREIVDFQRAIGSDIVTILDIFSRPDFTRNEAEDAVRITYERVREIEPVEDSFLAGPIQGSLYMDLRMRSSRLMGNSAADYLPIGGVVPLLEQYRYPELVRIIWSARRSGNMGKPVHLFGGGHPMFFALAVYLGVDMFDSASYVKYARDSRLLFPEGTRDLKKIRELPAWSPICSKTTAKELIQMEEKERTYLLAKHNLFAMFQELSEIKERIYEQNLWEYVQEKAMAHPTLYTAFREIISMQRGIEPFTELSRRSAYFHYGKESGRSLFEQRVKTFSEAFLSAKKEVVVIDGDHRPAARKARLVDQYESSDAAFVFPWCGIHVPVELEDTYPIQQIIGYDSGTGSDSWLKSVVKRHGLRRIEEPDSGQKIRDFNLEKIRVISDYQFGIGSGKHLFPDDTEIRVSRSTGRIRTASSEGSISATLRATDGTLGLTRTGAERLKKFAVYPQLSVVVSDESANYNRKGYSVFFKFIEVYDPEIRAGNETMILNREGTLIAAGRSTVSGKEMGDYRHGVAVKIHHSLEGRNDDLAPD